MEDLDDQYPEPQVSHSISFLKSGKDDASGIAYESRDFEDSNLTKHIAEQVMVLKIMMMVLAILSIFLSRLSEHAESLEVFGLQGEQVVLTTHSIMSAAMSIFDLMQLRSPS